MLALEIDGAVFEIVSIEELIGVPESSPSNGVISTMISSSLRKFVDAKVLPVSPKRTAPLLNHR